MPLYLAKVLAGATAAALAGLVIAGATAITFLAVWGTDGLDAPFQMYYIASPRPAAIWRILLPMLMLLVLYTLVCGGIAMLASALTRSAIVVLVEQRGGSGVKTPRRDKWSDLEDNRHSLPAADVL